MTAECIKNLLQALCHQLILYYNMITELFPPAALNLKWELYGNTEPGDVQHNNLYGSTERKGRGEHILFTHAHTHTNVNTHKASADLIKTLVQAVSREHIYTF